MGTVTAKHLKQKTGDIIKSFNFHPITSLADLRLALYAAEVDSVYPILIDRKNNMLEKNVPLAVDSHPSWPSSK